MPNRRVRPGPSSSSRRVQSVGESTSIQYDTYTRPTQTTSAHGAVTTYTYTNSPPTQTATTNGKWVKTTMDGLGRTIKAETGYSTTTTSVVDTEYDSCACSPLGKVKRVSQPHAPGPATHWTTYVYDGIGRTKQVLLPGGTGAVNYAYQGPAVTTVDPAGKWKRHQNDSLGNLVHVYEPNPGVSPSATRINAGGPAHTDPTGVAWSASSGFNLGGDYTNAVSISNTATPVLYQTERYGDTNGAVYLSCCCVRDTVFNLTGWPLR